MPAVLTTASTITCGHTGTVAKSSSAKLKVGPNANPVLIESSLGDISSNCATTPTPPPPGPKSTKCTKVSALTNGKSTKLKVGSNPVLLASLAGTTDGMLAGVTPLPGLSASAGQEKLKAS